MFISLLVSFQLLQSNFRLLSLTSACIAPRPPTRLSSGPPLHNPGYALCYYADNINSMRRKRINCRRCAILLHVLSRMHGSIKETYMMRWDSTCVGWRCWTWLIRVAVTKYRCHHDYLSELRTRSTTQRSSSRFSILSQIRQQQPACCPTYKLSPCGGRCFSVGLSGFEQLARLRQRPTQ